MVNSPLHKARTFVPPLSNQKIYQDAQWWPKSIKICFCATAAARPLCVPWTTKNCCNGMQQVVQRRQSGGRTIAMVVQGLPWSPNGGTMVVTVIKGRHGDVIKWKHFPRYWPFVRVIHRSPVNSPHKGQWRGAFMFTLICTRIKGWVNNCETCDLRRYRAHYDVIVMLLVGQRW